MVLLTYCRNKCLADAQIAVLYQIPRYFVFCNSELFNNCSVMNSRSLILLPLNLGLKCAMVRTDCTAYFKNPPSESRQQRLSNSEEGLQLSISGFWSSLPSTLFSSGPSHGYLIMLPFSSAQGVYAFINPPIPYISCFFKRK